MLCEKPNDRWIHAFELHTPQRMYRLFTDNYDVKQQWVFTLNAYLKHRQTPSNAQGPVCFTNYNSQQKMLLSRMLSKKHNTQQSPHQSTSSIITGNNSSVT